MSTRRLAWFHCFSGIAGDMALGALIDAGADFAELEKLLSRLPIGGYSLEAVPVLRGGIAGTHVQVVVKEDSVVRTAAHILGIVEQAHLPQRVHDRAISIFSALADVEGRLHRRNPSQVHFHELGGHDTIVDVVGTSAALELLDIDTVAASEVATGTGMVRTQHGMLPNPSPAVLGLLAGAPIYGRDLNIELTTPTGAAIISALSSGFGPMPLMSVEATGYGAGTREIDGLPNVTQVVIGTETVHEHNDTRGDEHGQPLVLLETNVDDSTGELLAHSVARALEEGAQDAWVSPVVMKKGRPGHVLSVLSDRSLVGQLRELLLLETGSLGVRATTVNRWSSSRQFQQVEVKGHPIRIKVSPGRAKAEFEDAARIAAAEHMPLRTVLQEAEQIWANRTTREENGPDLA